MSYREENGQVVLTMSREDYEWLLRLLGCLTTEVAAKDGPKTLAGMLGFMNRLTTPTRSPYQVEKS